MCVYESNLLNFFSFHKDHDAKALKTAVCFKYTLKKEKRRGMSWRFMRISFLSKFFFRSILFSFAFLYFGECVTAVHKIYCGSAEEWEKERKRSLRINGNAYKNISIHVQKWG